MRARPDGRHKSAASMMSHMMSHMTGMMSRDGGLTTRPFADSTPVQSELTRQFASFLGATQFQLSSLPSPQEGLSSAKQMHKGEQVLSTI